MNKIERKLRIMDRLYEDLDDQVMYAFKLYIEAYDIKFNSPSNWLVDATGSVEVTGMDER